MMNVTGGQALVKVQFGYRKKTQSIHLYIKADLQINMSHLSHAKTSLALSAIQSALCADSTSSVAPSHKDLEVPA